ncbi:MAG: hypothetical protein GY817_00520, partial [bacterium]|nr:hypothetical protein [bacterium]
ELKNRLFTLINEQERAIGDKKYIANIYFYQVLEYLKNTKKNPDIISQDLVEKTAAHINGLNDTLVNGLNDTLALAAFLARVEWLMTNNSQFDNVASLDILDVINALFYIPENFAFNFYRSRNDRSAKNEANYIAYKTYMYFISVINSLRERFTWNNQANEVNNNREASSMFQVNPKTDAGLLIMEYSDAKDLLDHEGKRKIEAITKVIHRLENLNENDELDLGRGGFNKESMRKELYSKRGFLWKVEAGKNGNDLSEKISFLGYAKADILVVKNIGYVDKSIDNYHLDKTLVEVESELAQCYIIISQNNFGMDIEESKTQEELVANFEEELG